MPRETSLGCGPHHKDTMFNRKDKYLGLNLVVVGMAFKINFTALVFLLTRVLLANSLRDCGIPVCMWKIFFHIHPPHIGGGGGCFYRAVLANYMVILSFIWILELLVFDI